MNKITLGLFAFMAVAMLGVSLVSAQGGLGFKNMDEEDKAEFRENGEAMRDAVESGDYEAWKILMNERIEQMKENLTEEDFQMIQERHQERAENKGEHERGSGNGFRRGLRGERAGEGCQLAE